eukprot:TRINITY_DN1028_c0_g1_i2.p3 TRINITY_DN1028_c0_g1~~TRINITY_DN1028_c0_g1_i2.p3  ORF type:complete len:100 (+),score=2.16 TRINITY_DN1028_c0_g1_i2:1318-1617(+)
MPRRCLATSEPNVGLHQGKSGAQFLPERLDAEEKMGDFVQSVIKTRTANSPDLHFITRTLLAHSKGGLRRSSHPISPPEFTTRKIDFERIEKENLFDIS